MISQFTGLTRVKTSALEKVTQHKFTSNFISMSEHQQLEICFLYFEMKHCQLWLIWNNISIVLITLGLFAIKSHNLNKDNVKNRNTWT